MAGRTPHLLHLLLALSALAALLGVACGQRSDEGAASEGRRSSLQCTYTGFTCQSIPGLPAPCICSRTCGGGELLMYRFYTGPTPSSCPAYESQWFACPFVPCSSRAPAATTTLSPTRPATTTTTTTTTTTSTVAVTTTVDGNATVPTTTTAALTTSASNSSQTSEETPTEASVAGDSDKGMIVAIALLGALFVLAAALLCVRTCWPFMPWCCCVPCSDEERFISGVVVDNPTYTSTKKTTPRSQPQPQPQPQVQPQPQPQPQSPLSPSSNADSTYGQIGNPIPTTNWDSASVNPSEFASVFSAESLELVAPMPAVAAVAPGVRGALHQQQQHQQQQLSQPQQQQQHHYYNATQQQQQQQQEALYHQPQSLHSSHVTPQSTRSPHYDFATARQSLHLDANDVSPPADAAASASSAGRRGRVYDTVQGMGGATPLHTAVQYSPIMPTPSNPTYDIAHTDSTPYGTIDNSEAPRETSSGLRTSGQHSQQQQRREREEEAARHYSLGAAPPASRTDPRGGPRYSQATAPSIRRASEPVYDHADLPTRNIESQYLSMRLRDPSASQQQQQQQAPASSRRSNNIYDNVEMAGPVENEYDIAHHIRSESDGARGSHLAPTSTYQLNAPRYSLRVKPRKDSTGQQQQEHQYDDLHGVQHQRPKLKTPARNYDSYFANDPDYDIAKTPARFVLSRELEDEYAFADVGETSIDDDVPESPRRQSAFTAYRRTDALGGGDVDPRVRGPRYTPTAGRRRDQQQQQQQQRQQQRQDEDRTYEYADESHQSSTWEDPQHGQRRRHHNNDEEHVYEYGAVEPDYEDGTVDPDYAYGASDPESESDRSGPPTPPGLLGRRRSQRNMDNPTYEETLPRDAGIQQYFSSPQTDV